MKGYSGFDRLPNAAASDVITGFSYFYETILPEMGFDEERFMCPQRDLIAVATDIETGRAHYFHKGNSDIRAAIQASATVPYISKPVPVGDKLYLDGGCSVKIPFRYAMHKKYPKIVVVRTRDRTYRGARKEGRKKRSGFYHAYPDLQRALRTSKVRYDRLLDEIDAAEQTGRIFVFAPGRPVKVSRFEGDLEKLGSLYWQGYSETWARMDELRDYLGAALVDNPGDHGDCQ